MNFGGMLVDGGRRLCAEIAVFHVEIERGNAKLAARASKLHPTLDALSVVVSHCLEL